MANLGVFLEKKKVQKIFEFFYVFPFSDKLVVFWFLFDF